MRFFAQIVWLLLALGPAAWCDVKPNALISHNAVLQQGMTVPVWGAADNGEEVTVKFQNQSIATTAQNGRWLVRLKPLKPGGPFTMTITGNNALTLTNILVGEVWLCSGQSNMEWPLSKTHDGSNAVAQARDPMLRLFRVPRKALDAPVTAVDAEWKECLPESAARFSAVGYYFGRDLRKARRVPVGLIDSSYGGSPVQAWTSLPALQADQDVKQVLDWHAGHIREYPAKLATYREAMKKHQAEVARAQAEGKEPPKPPREPQDPVTSPHRPAGLYNAMIAPLQPFAVKGAIWYQGESNAQMAWLYQRALTAMIRDWQAGFGREFPFLIVQLAPFMKKVAEPQEAPWPELREAQRLTALAVPKSALVVTTDVGDENDIHPRRKEPVGQRLALAARAIAYGEDIEYSGPMHNAARILGDRIVLTFNHTGGGLVARGDKLAGFAIAGADRKFVNANARIVGNKIEVWSAAIPKPVAVRYGWANYPTGNLWNRAGLPASPLRTDNFPLTTLPKPPAS
jgi:sialate O-acetylesterase